MKHQLALPLGAQPDGAVAPASAVVPVTREQQRSRRHRTVRGKTLSVKRMTKRELEMGRMLYPVEDAVVVRPRTRADCADIPRPCPFVSCVHHNYLDVSARTGSIKLNFPDLEPWDMPASESCSLDIADKGGTTLENVGRITNLTRERIRQVEVRSLAKLQARVEMESLREFYGDVVPSGKRRLPVLENQAGDRRRDGKDAEPSKDFESFASPELDD